MSRIFIHSAVGLEISKSIFWPVVVISVWSFVRCEILALRASVLLYGGGEDWMQWCTLSSRLRVDNLSTVASMFIHFISFFSAFLSSWIFCGYQNADTWLRVCRCNEAPSLSNWLKISGFFFLPLTLRAQNWRRDLSKKWIFSTLSTPLKLHYIFIKAVFPQASTPSPIIEVNPWTPHLDLGFYYPTDPYSANLAIFPALFMFS